MRTNVVFNHPAEFVLLSDEDGILAVDGAKWFVDMLSRIPGLQIDNELCQEDWGVAIRASARRKEVLDWIEFLAGRRERMARPFSSRFVRLVATNQSIRQACFESLGI